MAEHQRKEEQLTQLAALLRTELTGLHGALQAAAPAEMREADAALDRRAAAAERCFYRLLRLAGNLNDAELLLEQERPLPLRNVELVELLDGLCRQAQAPAELLGIRLSFSCRERAHIAAVSPRLLERLFWNLLANAMAVTPAGGQVRVSLQVLRGFLALSVSDEGPGLPEGFILPERWEPACAAGGRLGLGLPLCARIARGHGGSLLLSGGQGTTATVRLADRRLPEQDVREQRFDYTGGFPAALLELSDVLPDTAFGVRWQD